MISSYLRVVRRRWYVIPAVMLIAIGALLVGVRLSVTATSRVIVPFPGNQSDQNFQGVANSYEVSKEVIHDLRLKGISPDKLLAQVTVTLEYGTNIYDITVKDSNQARAIHICTAWTTDTVALYTKLNTAPASQAFLAAQQQLNSAHQNIAALQAQITAFEYAHPELVNKSTTTTGSTSVNSSGSQSATNSGTQGNTSIS
ncbi:MAG TPA: hypothetical protein VGN32_11550, partial [Ktedonobacterales bacterium]|nr:hypothetical protein [Ktedonobacterales bacterium]